MTTHGNQEIQALAYRFPYHYVPSLTLPDRITSYRTWAWSLSYLAGLKLVSTWLNGKEQENHQHLDIGCGDGALIHFLRPIHTSMKLIGTDYDEKALAWARLFNEGIPFIGSDLIKGPQELSNEIGSMDTVSLIEVAEHIDPSDLPTFLANAVSLLRPGGSLVLTVPHKNVKLSKKHFQHFTFDSLKSFLPANLSVETMACFEYLPGPLKLLNRALKNNTFYCELAFLERFLFRRMEASYSPTENGRCGRIFLTGTRKD